MPDTEIDTIFGPTWRAEVVLRINEYEMETGLMGTKAEPAKVSSGVIVPDRVFRRLMLFPETDSQLFRGAPWKASERHRWFLHFILVILFFA